jgi:hypothetical protein
MKTKPIDKFTENELLVADTHGTRPLNRELEPEILTDKDQTKLVPCRVCGRGCIVTQFAAAGKVSCSEHKSRKAQPVAVRDFDRSKETHVLTDKDGTKEVPCRTCGRPCIVTTFASAAKVACRCCRTSAPKPKKTTEYKRKNGNGGRHEAETTTQIFTETDLEWKDWIIYQPWHFKSVYSSTEQAEHDKARDVIGEQRQVSRVAKREAAEKDEQAMQTKKEAVAKKLEEEVVRLEGEYAAADMVIEATSERRDTLARIAYMRGAIAAGYRIEVDADSGKRTLVGRESEAPIPKDYLDAAGWHAAETVVKLDEPVAA